VDLPESVAAVEDEPADLDDVPGRRGDDFVPAALGEPPAQHRPSGPLELLRLLLVGDN